MTRRKLTPPERTLLTLILAGSVLYGAGPYFSDHLMIAGMGLLIIAVMVLSAALAAKTRRTN
ncbi:hypothetical protein ASC66_01110 [Leifsonia sp. Root4]|uniref:hypothetical protein n=1 Tax=Leifsonia sp. Root4 TaxID=1736525 RepID=UPI0006FEEABB|nr:hypothetical protein [Leifsonia sp. Root4]KQW07627.1 hypothetical protein ASC66_01110 [Leifsonia sp. Root4]